MNNDNNTEPVVYAVGARGYSAYEVAVQNGFIGTEQEWLDSLVGPQGQPFDELTPEQKAEIKGDRGYSAYEVAVQQGYEGTEEEWADSFLNASNYYNKDEINAKETDIRGEINETNENLLLEQQIRDNAVGALQSQIQGLSSGTPTAVPSTDEMTDTTQIYVNATDGKWYYYNGNAWTPGGDYLTGELEGSAWRGIFKYRIHPDTNRLAVGGWRSNNGESTTTASRFKNSIYIRKSIVIKNPDPTYSLSIHKYTINSSTIKYTHVNDDVIDITDNNYHYINALNADYIRIVVVDANGNTISPDDYKTIFNNIEFYVDTKDNIVPEEMATGGIYSITSNDAGEIYRETDDYNFSHYVIKPIYAEKDSIINIKIKKEKTYQDAPFGLNLFIYNNDKYIVQELKIVRINTSLYIKQGYYLVIVPYGSPAVRFDRFDINDYVEIEKIEARNNLQYTYKIPYMMQHERILNYDYGSGLVGEGITSDNDYLYVSGLVDATDNRAKIFKISIADPTDITVSDERAYGHANGLAKVDDKVAVAHMAAGKITLLNDSDLSEYATYNAVDILAQNGFKLGSVSSLAYNSKYGTYCLYGPKYILGEDPSIPNPGYLPKYFVITDKNFNIIKAIEFIAPRNVLNPTTGGCYMFDNMIAVINYKDVAATNNIMFYTWEGKLITTINLPYNYEIEGLTCVGDDYYVLFNNSSYQGFFIYKIRASVFKLFKDSDIINDFESVTNNKQSDINILSNSYSHIYNEVDGTPGTGTPATWF